MQVGTQYIKTLSGLLLGFLLIWIGVTGRLGSLLGALITPDFMVDGQEQFGGIGGTLPPGQYPVLITGTQLNMGQIGGLAWNAGIRTQTPLATAIAIAMAESGGRSDNINASSGATGLWQILLSQHPEYTQQQMLNPAQNAAAMYAISSGGTNWNPWQSYTKGTYKQFMSQANTTANLIIIGNTGASQK